MNVYEYPFDQQNCSLKIGTWLQDTNEVNLGIISDLNATIANMFPQLANYVKHSEWDLVNVSEGFTQSNERFMGLGISNDYYFSFKVKRGPLYSLINNIYPCFILNAITLINFFLPYSTQTSFG